MNTNVACNTCRLYAAGYTPEELGHAPEDVTPAINFILTDEDPEGDAGFGTCGFCGEASSLTAVYAEPYGAA